MNFASDNSFLELTLVLSYAGASNFNECQSVTINVNFVFGSEHSFKTISKQSSVFCLHT